MASQHRGNVLFIILLGVVIMAALSWAVSGNMKGGGNTAAKENNQSAIAEISNFMAAVRTATDNMINIDGIAPEQISYAHFYKQYNGAYQTSQDDNANCTSDTCRVFKPSGGGVTAASFEQYAVPSPYGILAANTMPGHINIIVFNFPYAGTSANDIVMQINYLKPSLCDAMDASGASAPINNALTGSWARGNVPAQWDSTGYGISGNNQNMIGKSIITNRRWNGPVIDNCDILQVLIER